MSVRVRGDTLGVWPDHHLGLVGGGKVVIEAGKRGAEVKGEGEVVKVGDQKGAVPANEGGGIVVMEGKEGGGTGGERAGGRGGERVPVCEGVPTRRKGNVGVGQGNKMEEDSGQEWRGGHAGIVKNL